ncbi:hypothetical protein E2F48_05515 [Arthrobacter crusticola]|uniref:Uncharacterized protein n=1 Tax=Arthrobacter crusticola TaxID=2547960 RepID=A0A4R5TZG7_9MICC|nr:hypothetical protein [Arthrobacter crusticola]TDK26645.1 hypothetical protein E2F48_05515 [Arthrobacter crusticola]
MTDGKMHKTVLRWGILLGVAGVLMLVFSPVIIGNFGTFYPAAGAPVAMAVTTLYSAASIAFLPFSASLVAASLVMRHAESLAARKEVRRDEAATG